MINFNAAQISIAALGLPAQQNQNTTAPLNNNFQALITSMLNNQIDSDKADVSAAITADPNTKNALFQSVSMLYLLGKIEAVSGLTTNEIINEPAVNAAIQNNNLNPGQAQLLASGIKITAIEISAGNIPLLNVSAVLQPLDPAAAMLQLPQANTTPAVFPSAGITMPVVPAVAAGNTVPVSVPAASAPAIIIPVPLTNSNVLPPIVPAAQPANTAPVLQAFVIPAVVPATNVSAPAITEYTAAPVVVTTATVKPVQVSAEPAVVIPVVNNITVKPAIPSAVTPALKPAALPLVLNTLAGKIQAVNISGGTLDKAAVEEVNKLVAELQNIIKDFTALIYTLTEKNKDVPAEAKLINNKVNELADKINVLNTVPAENSELVKSITSEAADILGVIAAALYRIAQPFSNTPAVSGAIDSASEQTNLLLNAGTGSGPDYSSNRQITVAAGLTEEAKDLISRIYSLLKSMNGELYMAQKTDYVYQPFSGSSSQVTKDGVLLINTGAGSQTPAAVVNNIQTGTNPVTQIPQPMVTNSPAVMTAPKTPVIQAVAAEMIPVITAPFIVKTPVPAANNTTVVTDAEQVISSSVPSIIIPSIRNSEKASMLLSESNSTYIKDVDWLKDSISSYVVTVTGKEDAQLPVNIKVFEKAADVAGRVKESIVIKQVVQNIQNAVQVTGRTEIKMFLRPDNMGPVTIKLDSRDNIISGRIEAANVAVKDILKANLPELRAALVNVGINVSNLDVSIMSGYIGSSLSDSSGNQYAEWEGSAMRPDAEVTLENAGAASGVDGYLNFLA